MNTLYYGDNLDILREYVKEESVDLIYLDPPFKSNQDYNVLFKEASGEQAAAQILAFEDTWHWDSEVAPRTYEEIVRRGGEVADMIRAFKTFLRTGDMMAYLVMMAPRLSELRRVLKPTGSIYLHCDPTASHYLKLLMDAVFGGENFRNEIVWRRAQPKSHTSIRMSRAHDVILFYARSPKAHYAQQYTEHDPEYLEKFYKYIEPETGRRYRLGDVTNPNKNRPNLTYEFPPKSGVVRVWRWTRERMVEAWEQGKLVYPREGAVVAEKRYLDEMEGTPVTDFWDDIEHLHGVNRGPEGKGEGLGYPTQKPEALLERIIMGSSKEGDVVLDPFCGCGTAIAVAQKLNRKWIGIDITHLAINLIERRLRDGFGLVPGKDYKEFGIPKTIEEAKALASRDKFEFQKWALVFLADAHPYGNEWKKGADRGIDGRKYFVDGADRHDEQIIYSVKGGGVDVKDVRDLGHVVHREKAAIGILITLEKPTRPMKKEASEAGYYHSSWRDPKHMRVKELETQHPRLQILTVEDLMNGVKPDLPLLAITPNLDRTFRKAKKATKKAARTDKLNL